MKSRTLALLFYLIFIRAFAQENELSSRWLGSNIHYGFVAAHHESMQYLVQGHVPGLEVNLFQTQNNHKQWHRDYRQPEIGLSALIISLSNRKQLGFGFSVYPYINFPLARKKNFELKFRTSVFIGYLSKVFDPVENFKNSAVGSHLNGTVNLRLNAHNQLSENIRLEYGIGLTHFSNGAFKMPNLGVNIPTFSAGLSYKIKNITPKAYSDTTNKNFSRNQFTIIAGGCKAEVEPPTGNRYAAFTVSATYDRLKQGNKHRFVAGVEAGYNGGNAFRLKYEDFIIEKKSDLLQAGIKIGYAMRVGRLELPVEFGHYLYSLYTGNGKFFHRIGLRYYTDSGFMLNATFKTHWAKAEYWEFGLGYVFKKRKALIHEK